MSDFNLGEVQRQLANMIRVGKVVELDEANARVKVQASGLTTAWLPWGASRAGTTRTTSMPTVGEQVVVFSPYGDTAQGVVGFSLYQDNHPAASDSKDKHATDYPDGTRVEYNSQTNTYTMTVAGDAKVIVNCKQATVNAENTVTVNTKQATINAENTATVNTKTATVDASTSVTLDTPTTTCTGNLTVQGAISYGAGMTGTGGATVNGGMNIVGGSLTHNSKNIGSTHTHSGVQSGLATTGAPV